MARSGTVESMAEALVMMLDPAAADAIETLRSRLSERAVPRLAFLPHFPPHVSLAVAERLVLPAPSLAEQIACQRLEVRMETLGTFAGSEGVLMCGVTVTAGMLEIHAAVQAALAGDGGGPCGHYRPGRWVPHCTVAIGLDHEELGAAVAAAHPFDAICAQVSNVEIVDTMTGEIVPGRVV